MYVYYDENALLFEQHFDWPVRECDCRKWKLVISYTTYESRQWRMVAVKLQKILLVPVNIRNFLCQMYDREIG